jgi:hypothetical protein
MSKSDYKVRLVKKENGWDVIIPDKEVLSFTESEEFEAREFFQSVARYEMDYASGYTPK